MFSIEIAQGERGLRSMLQRAQKISGPDQQVVRFRSLDPAVQPPAPIDAFVQTPFDVLASRRVLGTLKTPDGVVGIRDALAGWSGPPADLVWTSALPPVQGFQLLDEVPVAVARELADQGQALARQFSGPLGPPRSLLDQTVLEVEGNGMQVEIPMRLVFTCASFGFIPALGDATAAPRHLKVSQCGRWVRVDAPFGSVYLNRGLPLLL